MSKIIYLTFDDGPNPPYTEQILEILARYNASESGGINKSGDASESGGVKATFFVCGQNAQKYPDLIRRIVAEGHALGNHAFSHSMRLCFSPLLYEEFVKNAALLREISRVDVKLARAPWGLMLPSVKRKLQSNGQKVFHWDIAAYDWWNPSSKYIADKIVRAAQNRAHSGQTKSIILLHDGNQTKGGKRSNTVDALSEIIERLGEDNFIFSKLA